MSSETTTTPPPKEEEFVLNLIQAEEPVKIRVDGEIRTYVLREMIGQTRDEYMNGMSKRVKVSPDGKVIGISEYVDVQASLITRCLFTDQNRPVDIKTIRGWPASAQKYLFDKCQKLNALDDNAEETQKKE